MTQEQFYEAQKMRDDEFAVCCEANPDFEIEFYAWVDYFTVLRLQQENKTDPKLFNKGE